MTQHDGRLRRVVLGMMTTVVLGAGLAGCESQTPEVKNAPLVKDAPLPPEDGPIKAGRGKGTEVKSIKDRNGEGL
jgi:hypothetical protein